MQRQRFSLRSILKCPSSISRAAQLVATSKQGVRLGGGTAGRSHAQRTGRQGLRLLERDAECLGSHGWGSWLHHLISVGETEKEREE